MKMDLLVSQRASRLEKKTLFAFPTNQKPPVICDLVHVYAEPNKHAYCIPRC